MDWLTNPDVWISFCTLTLLEIVLGIDNIVFISILAGKLPEAQRSKARQLGLMLALVTRVLLLLSLTWIMRLTQPMFSVGGHDVSGRDLILLAGGLFLMWKAVREIHEKLEGEEGAQDAAKATTFSGVVWQILVLDIVFSLDSVITAVGMASQVGVMVAAVIAAIGFMLMFSGRLSDFVDEHPTVKMLALAFLVLIGANLVAEGWHYPIPKGYTYFAMTFAVGVEMLNIRTKKKRASPVHLRRAFTPEDD